MGLLRQRTRRRAARNRARRQGVRGLGDAPAGPGRGRQHVDGGADGRAEREPQREPFARPKRGANAGAERKPVAIAVRQSNDGPQLFYRATAVYECGADDLAQCKSFGVTKRIT